MKAARALCTFGAPALLVLAMWVAFAAPVLAGVVLTNNLFTIGAPATACADGTQFFFNDLSRAPGFHTEGFDGLPSSLRGNRNGSWQDAYPGLVVPSARHRSARTLAGQKPPVSSNDALADALLLPDGTLVFVPAAAVTAVFSDGIYVESLDKTQGVLVTGSGGGYEPGDVVTVNGTTGTASNYERFIYAPNLGSPISTVPPLRPLALSAPSVAGGDFYYDPVTGAGKRGAYGALGNNNVGKLVQVNGYVTHVGGDFFYVDDGSNCDDGSGYIGVRAVVRPDSYTPYVGDYVTVVGVSTLIEVSGNYVGAVRVRVNADIQVRTSLYGTSEFEVYPGVNWISFCRIPITASYPNPPELFGPAGIDIEWTETLVRFDQPTQSLVMYQAWDPWMMFNVLVGEGYELGMYYTPQTTVQYSGLRVLNDFTVSIPVQGQFWFGNPYIYPVLWEDLEVTDGQQTMTVTGAVTAGWLGANWYTWDPIAQQTTLVDPSDPGQSAAWLLPGQMYKGTSLVAGLALTIPLPPDGIWGDPISGNWSDPANWLSGRQPPPGTPIVIEAPGDYTITVDSGAVTDIGSLSLGAGNLGETQRLVVPEGITLDVGANADINVGGALDLQEGEVTVTGDLANGGSIFLVCGDETLQGAVSSSDTALLNITGKLFPPPDGKGSITVTYKGVPTVSPLSVEDCIYPGSQGSLTVLLDPPNWMTSPTTFPLMQSTSGIVGDFGTKSFPTLYSFAWGTQKSQEDRWMYRVYSYDTTPPDTPLVIDDGAYTSSANTLHAIWGASDPQSGIAEYQYAIGTSPGDTNVVYWTSAETSTGITRSDLSLSDGTSYFFSVTARNGSGLWSSPANSDGILCDRTAPTCAIGAPSVTGGKTCARMGDTVSYGVSYEDANPLAVDLTPANVTVTKEGTVTTDAVAVVNGATVTPTVNVPITGGDGTVKITIAAGRAHDGAFNTDPGAGPSAAVTVDNTAPSVMIGSPSLPITECGPVSYTITYGGADNVTPSAGNVTLNQTGSANGTVAVSGTGNASRTVTISGITGEGTLGISIAAETASDCAGNLAEAAGPSAVVTVYLSPAGPLPTIAEGKGGGDGFRVQLDAAIVSAAWDNVFYVEADDKSLGIRVAKTSHGLTAGMKADIVGTMQTNSDGERYIEATTAVQSDPPNSTGSVAPLALNNKSLGGGDFNYVPGTTWPATVSGQKGVAEGCGLNQMGLLVTTTGRVVGVGSDYVCIDDGSLVDGGSGNVGVKVLHGSANAPCLGSHVVVTGISSCYAQDQVCYRQILAASIGSTQVRLGNDAKLRSYPGADVGSDFAYVDIQPQWTITTDNHIATWHICANAQPPLQSAEVIHLLVWRPMPDPTQYQLVLRDPVLVTAGNGVKDIPASPAARAKTIRPGDLLGFYIPANATPVISLDIVSSPDVEPLKLNGADWVEGQIVSGFGFYDVRTYSLCADVEPITGG